MADFCNDCCLIELNLGSPFDTSYALSDTDMTISWIQYGCSHTTFDIKIIKI